MSMFAPNPTEVKTEHVRNALINSVLKIGHGNLSVFTPAVLPAAHEDPELLAHLVAWNHTRTKVRDSQVALPVLAMRSTAPKRPSALAEWRENAIAHLMLLGPRELVRALVFNQGLTKAGNPVSDMGGFDKPHLLRQSVEKYLRLREDKPSWWDRMALSSRTDVAQLYRWYHVKPSPRADAILFKHEYPANSVFAVVKALHTMEPIAAASEILRHHIPFPIAIGACPSIKSEAVLLALISQMTGNQTIQATGMLKRLGVLDNPVLHAAYTEALGRMETDARVAVLKADKAVAAVGAESTTGRRLVQAQQAALNTLGGLEGDWAVLVDKSGSMSSSIAWGTRMAAFIAERTKGHVQMVFFDTSPYPVNVTGMTLAELTAVTRRMGAHGGTSIGCAMDWLRVNQVPVQGVVIVSDGAENTMPRFTDVYKKYCAQMSLEPALYLFHVDGDLNSLAFECKRADIEIDVQEMAKFADDYSLPNVISILRTRRYALVDEVMTTPLLTVSEVFESAQ